MTGFFWMNFASNNVNTSSHVIQNIYKDLKHLFLISDYFIHWETCFLNTSFVELKSMTFKSNS